MKKTTILSLLLSVATFACTDETDDYPVQPGGGDGFGVVTQGVITQHVRSLAATNQSVCANLDDDTVWCWGANGYGELGDGTTFSRALPTQANITGVSAIYGGGNTFCAVKNNDNSLYCWGRSFQGLFPLAFPTQYAIPDSSPLHVAIGEWHACATYGSLGSFSAHNIYCWGKNDRGQLGLGDTVNRTFPTLMPQPSTSQETWDHAVVGGAILGNEHTCATSIRLFDHVRSFVYCAGSGQQGQNGFTSDKSVMTPLQRPGGRFPAFQLAAGDKYTCANYYRSGTSGATDTWCWGTGFGGPTVISGFPSSYQDPVLYGEASSSHMCAGFFGYGRCWGANNHGELGNSTAGPSGGPLDIYYLEGRFLGPVSLSRPTWAVGGEHTHAIGDDTGSGTGFAYSWGRGSEGELGVNSGNDYYVPVWSHI